MDSSSQANHLWTKLQETNLGQARQTKLELERTALLLATDVQTLELLVRWHSAYPGCSSRPQSLAEAFGMETTPKPSLVVLDHTARGAAGALRDLAGAAAAVEQALGWAGQ